MTLDTEAPRQHDLYHDTPPPLPQYEDRGQRLLEVVDLTTSPAPEGAARYVKTQVHVVQRGDGTIGHQVVNELSPGASLLAVDTTAQNHAYAILVDQMRYPHLRPGDTSHNLEAAARAGRIGRWGREIPSGGVNAGEPLEVAALREGQEEAGIIGVTPDRVHRLFPTLGSSVSTNYQPFNLFYTILRDGEFQPEAVHRDVEEGDMRVAAYRLDTAIPEMIGREIWEMSTVTALMGLWRVKELRKYL